MTRLLAIVIITLAGCAAGSPEPPFPSELVGAWTSSSGDARLDYQFASDSTYEFTGILTQQRDTGVFIFTATERGTATVRGNILILQPKFGVRSYKDPGDPGNDRDEPAPTEARKLPWTLTSGVLTLVDENGTAVTYDRS
jgi:hypothetical protein